MAFGFVLRSLVHLPMYSSAYAEDNDHATMLPATIWNDCLFEPIQFWISPATPCRVLVSAGEYLCDPSGCDVRRRRRPRE